MKLRRGFTTGAVTCALAAAVAALASPALAATTNVVQLPLCCIPSGTVTAVAVDGNTAYVGGTFQHMGLPRHHLAVVDPTTGQPQDGWPGVDGGSITTAVSDNGGGWYVGGTFTSIGGVPRAGLAHIKSDKSVDPAWAPSTNGTVKALCLAGGKVFVGGTFSQVDGNVARANLAALDPTTGADTGFSEDTNGTVNVLASSLRFTGVPPTTPVLRLYVGGSFSSPTNNLAVVDPNAATPNTVGDTNVNGAVTALGVGGGGTLSRDVYVGGAFTAATAGSVAALHLAKFNDQGTLDTSWIPNTSSVSAILPVGSTIYLAGGFTAVNGTGRSGLAAVNDTNGNLVSSWQPSVYGGSGPLTAFRALAASNDGNTIYVGGRFYNANGSIRDNLVALDASTGSTLAWDPDPADFRFGVDTIASDGSSIFVTGRFEQIGGAARSNLAAVDLTSGQVTSFNPGVTGPNAAVFALAVRGSTLYVGGRFDHVGALARNGAAAIDLSTGAPTAFDPQLDNGSDVLALAPTASSVFLGGSFLHLGATARAYLAEADGQTGAATAFHQDLDSDAGTLAYKDGVLYVGGPFNSIGGVSRKGFAAVNVTPGGAGAVSPFDPQFDGAASSVLPLGDTVYVGGNFTHVLASIARNHMAAFGATSIAVLPFDPNFDQEPDALAADDSEIFGSGGFTTVSGQPRPGAVALDLATGLASPWAPAPTFPSGTSVTGLGASPSGGVVLGGDALFAAGSGFLRAYAIAPSTPAAPTATAGPQQATVAFDPPAAGGSRITQYTVTASPGGQTTTGAASPITVTGLTAGTTYTFTVSAANAAGTGPLSPASNPVTPTAPPAAPAPGQSPGPAPGAGNNAGSLTASAFKVTHKRFAVGRKKTAVSARKTPTGTTFTFKLSAAAVSRITIAQQLKGRKKGKRCVAPRKGLEKKCTRLKKIGVLTRKRTKAGANKVPFSGRLGKKALRPGRYKATLVATDAAGHKSGPLSLVFTVVKAKRR